MAQEYLKRNNSTTGNRKTWTWAGWVKLSGDVHSVLYSSDGASDTDRLVLGYYNNYFYLWGTSINFIQTTRKVRDVGNWHHILVHLDTTQSYEEQRLKLYIDGAIVEEFNTDNRSSLTKNSIRGINRTSIHAIGRDYGAGGYHAEANLTDIFLVDGQALTPDVFGFYKDGKGYASVGSSQATDFRPGQWSPHAPAKIKKDIERRGGFGNNGFYLPMNDNSNPGADFHCTPNTIIKLKGEDLPQPRNGAPTTSDSYVSELRKETGELGFAGCVKFDGNGDRLNVANSADLQLGSGDFCLEAYIYLYNVSKHQGIIGNNQAGSGLLRGYEFDVNANGALMFYSGTGSAYSTGSNLGGISSSGIIRKGRWYHVAAVRNGNTFSMYADGVKVLENTSFTHTIASTTDELHIGNDGASTGTNYHIDGFISNARIVKGSPVYTGNFTPPTGPLTQITNTKLLCCNSSTSATASTVTPATISTSGTPFATTSELTGSIVAAIPGISGGLSSGYGDYSADIRGTGTNKTTTSSGNVTLNTVMHSHYGSGMRFSGNGTNIPNGGYVYIDSTGDFNLQLDDFTLEGWIYAHTSTQDAGVFGVGNSGAEPTVSWTNGVLRFRSDAGILITSPVVIAAEQWHHVVLESHNQLLRLIINGVVVGTHQNTHTFSQGQLLIGSWNTGKQYGFDGDIQDVRLYNNVAKYKGGFDVARPYAPVGVEDFRVVPDTCRNNFATFNPLIGAGIASGDTVAALKDGNLYYDNANQSWTSSTLGVSSGKYYAEFMVTGGNFSSNIGVCGELRNKVNNQQYHSARGISYIRLLLAGGIDKEYNDTSFTEYIDYAPYYYTSGHIIGVTIDYDNREVKYYKNGTLVKTDNTLGSYTPLDHTYYFLAFRTNDGASTPGANWSDVIANFGQNPTFCGETTAGTNADDSGKGLFKYAPPSGFLALCEDNLSTPAVADPGKHFKSVVYQGNGIVRHAISGVGFKPDFVWLKGREGTNLNHILCDTVRGPIKTLFTNNQLQDYADRGVVSFDENGFTLLSGGGDENFDGRPYVAWCWKAGGPVISNNDGSITSQISVNRDAGFSIVSYDGNNTNNTTVGHGLGKTPALVVTKSRSNSITPAWHTSHVSLDANYDLALDYIGPAWQPAGNGWHELTNSSVFTLKNGSVDGNNVNKSGDSYIAYCWAEIEGYSKFGKWIGNASTDGPFVYCGFRPAWVMYKRTDTNGDWAICDSSRNPTNPITTRLFANTMGPDTDGVDPLDFVSNGFKVRTNAGSANASAAPYVFIAFAESPFQTANAK